MLLLKKKKYTEKVLEKTDNELMTIENLIMDIEYKNVEQNVLKGIEVGNEALKKLNAVFSIEKIEALLEETEEGIQKQQVNSFSMIIIHDQIPLTNIFFQEISQKNCQPTNRSATNSGIQVTGVSLFQSGR